MVDPISTSLVTAAISAVVGGAGGEAGKQAWVSLSELIRRTFRRDSAPQATLAAVQDAPADAEKIQRLAQTLIDQTHDDTDFADNLRAWIGQAGHVRHAHGDTANIVAGSAQVNQLIQGRDFHGTIHFGPSNSGR